MQTQIADIIVPAPFTPYQVENFVVTNKFFQSGVVAKNGLIADQLAAGATFLAVRRIFYENLVISSISLCDAIP